MGRHAQAVQGHMRKLGQKSYWSQFKEAPDFVVLFLPGESFFSAALEQNQTLIEEGMKSGVVLASPTTLIALLRAVAYGWRQEELAENAGRIAEAGKELYERITVFAGHLKGVGAGLKAATDKYNEAVGSYQARLEPGARRLTELGASTGKDLPDVGPVEGPSRAIAAPGDAPGDTPV
jgi:DNA recombination protein RmuC